MVVILGRFAGGMPIRILNAFSMLNLLKILKHFLWFKELLTFLRWFDDYFQ